jgi:hypothetical protein
MGAFRTLLLICIVYTVPAFGQTTEQPFTITIGASKSTVKAGSDVYIWVKQKNTSDHDVDCAEAEEGAAIVSYSYDVRDEDGKPVRKRDMSFPYAGKHWDKCSLEAGKTADRNLLLSWLYDFSQPGRYVVQISRSPSLDSKGHRAGESVKSNIITITVEEPDAPVAPSVYPTLK